MFGVSVVEQRAHRDQLLNGADMALSHGIVDWGLAILVLSVHRIANLLDKEVDCCLVTFTASIEQGCLLELILLGRAYALLDEHFDHLESQFVVGHDTGREDRCLEEIFGFIDDRGTIDVEVPDHSQDFINLSLFHLLEQCLVDLVEHTGGKS